MKYIILTITALYLLAEAYGQKNIDFNPKMLSNEIKSISRLEHFALKEFDLNSDKCNNTGKYFKAENAANIKYIYIGRVNTCRAGGCKSPSILSLNEKSEFFDYFILYDSTAKVLRVKVYNYQATHGQEITVKGWLRQFTGFDGSYEMLVGKNVNAISGATISVYGITDDITARTLALKDIVSNSDFREINGQAQGTTYKFIYKDVLNKNFQSKFDSLLALIDNTFSLYNNESILTKINNNQESIEINYAFKETFLLANSISARTEGAFDITACKNSKFNYKDVKIVNNKIVKKDNALKLDFNAIAQGLTVDFISEYLQNQGIFDYLIEIGGEIRCSGKNQNNELWNIGIDCPVADKDNSRNIQKEFLCLTDKAIATSGNFRNKGHIINNLTGKSADNEILSITVITDKCALADAYATAFKVMGIEKSIEFIAENPWLQAYFIYRDQNGNLKTYKTFDTNKIADK